MSGSMLGKSNLALIYTPEQYQIGDNRAIFGSVAVQAYNLGFLLFGLAVLYC